MHSKYYDTFTALQVSWYIPCITFKVHLKYILSRVLWFTVLHSRHLYTFTVLLCKHEMKHPLTQQVQYWARRSWDWIENTQTISQLFWSENMHCYRFIAMNPCLWPLIHIFILIKHYSGLDLYWSPVCFNRFITWFDIYSLCASLL